MTSLFLTDSLLCSFCSQAIALGILSRAPSSEAVRLFRTAILSFGSCLSLSFITIRLLV